MTITNTYLQQLVRQIINCALKVHRKFGAGMQVAAYEALLKSELAEQQLQAKGCYELFKSITIQADQPGCVYLLVEDQILVQLLNIPITLSEQQQPCQLSAWQRQLLAYLKLSRKPLGLSINFNCIQLNKHIMPIVATSHLELLIPPKQDERT